MGRTCGSWSIAGSGEGDGLGVPRAVGDREHPGAARRGELRDEATGQGMEDEVLEADPGPRPRHELGVVLGEPAQLGQGGHRMDGCAGSCVQRGCERRGAQVPCHVTRAGIGPRDDRRHRPGIVVERDQAVHRGAHRDRDHGCSVELGHTVGERLQRRSDDDLGVLDPPARLGPDQGVLVHRGVRRTPPRVGVRVPRVLEGHDLGCGRADVDPDDVVRSFRAVSHARPPWTWWTSA